MRAIEAELGVELPPDRMLVFNEARYGASDVRAYELWRKALDLKFSNNLRASDEDLHQALQYNLEAVAIDPNFDMGYVGLGATYGLVWRRSGDPRDREAQKKAFDRALQLDGQNVVAIGNRANLAAEDRDWTMVVELIASFRFSSLPVVLWNVLLLT